MSVIYDQPSQEVCGVCFQRERGNHCTSQWHIQDRWTETVSKNKSQMGENNPDLFGMSSSPQLVAFFLVAYSLRYRLVCQNNSFYSDLPAIQRTKPLCAINQIVVLCAIIYISNSCPDSRRHWTSSGFDLVQIWSGLVQIWCHVRTRSVNPSAGTVTPMCFQDVVE